MHKCVLKPNYVTLFTFMSSVFLYSAFPFVNKIIWIKNQKNLKSGGKKKTQCEKKIKLSTIKVISKNDIKSGITNYYELRRDCVLDTHDGEVVYLTFEDLESEFKVYTQIVSMKFFKLYIERKIFCIKLCF